MAAELVLRKAKLMDYSLAAKLVHRKLAWMAFSMVVKRVADWG